MRGRTTPVADYADAATAGLLTPGPLAQLVLLDPVDGEGRDAPYRVKEQNQGF